MYLLLCPCIREPDLRAEGITSDRDREVFDRVLERCTRFGIPIRYLPCPETRYLGRNRQPGTYAERLDTPEFHHLIEACERETRELITENGMPLLIVGVNSSPTCGVDRNWRTPAGKEPGRGEFLARFADIPADDVCSVAAYRVYLAAPLFSEAEQAWNRRVADKLRSYAYHVYLPQEFGDTDASRGEAAFQAIFRANHEALDASDLVVAVIDGSDADSGTCWEMGYAYAKGIPVIALRTDFRMVGEHEHVNLMLEQASEVVRSLDELVSRLPCPIEIRLPAGHQQEEGRYSGQGSGTQPGYSRT